MVWDLIKQFIKKLPGIRYVVRGRDRYIQLYTELLVVKEQLECQLVELQSKLDVRELEAVNAGLANQELKEECSSLKVCIEEKVLELAGARDTNRALREEVELVNAGIAHLQAESQLYKDDIARLLSENQHQLDTISMLQGEVSKLETELTQKQEEILRFNFRANTESLDSGAFWNAQYSKGGNSGTGSYKHLAQFKSDTVNAFLMQNNIVTVLEIGCGDGNQLQQIQYIEYVGVDVSPIIIEKNREKFKEDGAKRFYCTLTERDQYVNRTYNLTISMDVIFHLLEDDVFHQYLDDLFTLSEKFVVIYSSNHEEYTCWPEYRHRNFTGYVQQHYPDWKLIQYIPNKYPYQIGKESETSASDFYFFVKTMQHDVLKTELWTQTEQ